ncbi:cytochrome C [Enhygromyxa salina]|uniref:cytochrome C n=1 Tax=Enhygromyxa salina TaxID=215803 RepID=UPI0004E79F55|nr:cytochrome C [Enhygromyxa salina]
MSSSSARGGWIALVFAVLAVVGACRPDAPTPELVREQVQRDYPPLEPPPAPDLAKLWSRTGCTANGCHNGIEPIRQPDTGMMQKILARGREFGDRDGCTVCHGGDASATSPGLAHTGTNQELAAAGGPDQFFADPASPWVNERSCGQCHAELVAAQWNSLMMTEAGKIQGTTWSFGIPGDYEHRWANYDAKNPEDPHARLGTDAYRVYMQSKTEAHPNVFVDSHEQLPAAPAPGVGDQGWEQLRTDPSRAAYTYIRSECQRCHLGVKGRQKRGDYRGMGCGACHLPYGNEGLYEGGDAMIPRDEPGRPLVHSIQATRDSWVHANGQAYTGVPVETCTTCHNRGKRIGVSYQGLMESAWASPYTEGGGGAIEQPGLHTKHYIAMQQDIHYQKGMLCQDCHTSGDVHGDGFLAAANLGPIEIECTDCHGTPSAMPWELPLGWGDENARADLGTLGDQERGVATQLPEHLRAGAAAEPEDGWILTARGNPMPEVVRRGDSVLIHTAGGKTLVLDPLAAKSRRGGLSVEAEVAMVHSDHLETMECYACHASWAPQCYGCHVEVDYRDSVASYDWVAAGNRHKLTAAGRVKPDELGWDDLKLPGKVTEMRSYMRWEDPPLGMNGEGRVTPLIPGCQTSATVIGPDGEVLALNQIFRTPPNTEGGGEQGQLGIDMSPVQPHTIGKSRSCESCHGSDKALGYGIGGGRMTAPWDDDKVVDLTTADGRVISRNAKTQIAGIDGLADWSAIVDRDGNQLQTVGHHFAGSGPLPDDMRARMDRNNVCIGCHQEIPEASLAVSVLSHVSTALDLQPTEHDAHEDLIDKILLSAAWLQVLGVGLGGVLFLGGVWLGWRRLRRRE